MTGHEGFHDVLNCSFNRPEAEAALRSLRCLRGERRRDDFPQQVVERADLLLQHDVLLLCLFLPLLSDLQRLHQLRVLHVQILQQHAGLCVLRHLQTRQKYVDSCVYSSSV